MRSEQFWHIDLGWSRRASAELALGGGGCYVRGFRRLLYAGTGGVHPVRWIVGSGDQGSPPGEREGRDMRRMYAAAAMVVVPSILAVLTVSGSRGTTEPIGIEPEPKWRHAPGSVSPCRLRATGAHRPPLNPSVQASGGSLERPPALINRSDRTLVHTRPECISRSSRASGLDSSDEGRSVCH
jgi:hypothetical protein